MDPTSSSSRYLNNSSRKFSSNDVMYTKLRRIRSTQYFTRLFTGIIIFSTFCYHGIDGQPCPNSCSSHGRCTNPARQCYCFAGYTGPDCSLKSCPYGSAWADLAMGTDNAHNAAECSNMGTCDRATGKCTCQAGFTGEACERMNCPGTASPCNGVGLCQSMLYYALTKDPGYGAVYTYNSTWDSEKVWGCNCDDKYYGPDCSQQNCPRGDDPLTGNGANTPSNPVQYNEIQRVSCKAGGGTFTLTYGGQTTSPIPYNAKAADLLAYIGALPNIGVGNVKIVMFGTQGKYPDPNSTFVYHISITLSWMPCSALRINLLKH